MKNLNQAVPTPDVAVTGNRSAVSINRRATNLSSSQRRGAVTQNLGTYNAELLTRDAVKAASTPSNHQPNEVKPMKYVNQSVPTESTVTTAPAVNKPGTSNADKRALNTYHDPSCTYICAPEPESTSPQRREANTSRTPLRLVTSLRRAVFGALLGLFAASFVNTAVAQVTISNLQWNASTSEGTFTVAYTTSANAIYIFFADDEGSLNSIPLDNAHRDRKASDGAGYILRTVSNNDCNGSGASRVCTFSIGHSVATGSDILDVGSFYVAVASLLVPSTRTKPDADNLGGANNPIIFPGTPTSLTVSGSNLSWTQASASHDGFTLYYGTSSGIGTGSTSTTIAKNAVTCTGTGATQTCTYPIASLPINPGFFKLAANGSMSLRSALSSREFVLPHVVPTTAPTISRVAHTGSGITLDWNKPTNSVGFTIYHGTSSGVTTASPNPISLTLAQAGCTGDDSCTYTIPYDSTFTATGRYYFGITADGTNDAASALSSVTGGGEKDFPVFVFHRPTSNACAVTFDPMVDNHHTMTVTLRVGDLSGSTFCRLPYATGGSDSVVQYQLLASTALSALGLRVRGGNPSEGSSAASSIAIERLSSAQLIVASRSFEYNVQSKNKQARSASGNLTIRVVAAEVGNLTPASGPYNVDTELTAPSTVTTGSSPVNITGWAWETCDAETDGTCTAISGATSSNTYTIAAGDRGANGARQWIRTVVSGSGFPDIATNRVEIDRIGSVAIGGTVEQNTELTATLSDDRVGTQVEAITNRVYRWYRGGSSVTPDSGTLVKTSASDSDNVYTPSQEDVGMHLVVSVTYDGRGGATTSNPVVSTATVAVGDVDDPGTASIENVIFNVASAATLNDPDGGVTGESYEWQVCTAARTESAERVEDSTNCSAISGATLASFTAQQGTGSGQVSAGDHIRVKITYTDDEGTGKTAFSDTKSVVAASLGDATSNNGSRTENYVGDVLTAGTFSLDDVTFGSYSWQWQRAGNSAFTENVVNIPNATSESYTIGVADIDKHVRVEVTATGSGGIGEVTLVSNNSFEVDDRDGTVTLRGAVVGTPSRVSVSDPDGPATVSSVTWQICETAESGCSTAPADSDNEPLTYTPVDSQVDRYLKATAITYTGAGGGMGLSTDAVRITAVSAADIVKTVLPEISLVVFDTIASAVQNRVQVARSGNANPQLNIGGKTDFASIVKSQAELEMNDSRDNKRLIGSSSFAVTGDGANGNRFGFWGVGSNRSLSGESAGDESAANSQKLEWDGGLTGFTLGGDLLTADGKLFGIALNSQSGDLEVKSSNTHDYEVSVTSLTPYLGWTMGNYEITANLSIGSGDGTLTQQGTTMKSTHDLSMNSVSVSGSSGAIWQSEKSQLRAKADLLFGSTSVTPTGDSAMDESQSLSVSRLRLSANADHNLSNALKLTAELGARLDSGDGNGGLGVELGAGANFAAGNLRLHAKFRTLLLQTEDIGEFGLEFGAQLAPGSDGQGLSLSLTPTYGQTQSGLDTLWQNGISELTRTDLVTDVTDYQMRVNARLGFGLAFPNTGLITPYATARYGDTSQFGFGVNWKPKIRDLELDLLGEQIDTQQRILLKGSLGF